MRIGQTSFVNFLTQIATSFLGFLATLYVAKALGPRGDDVLGVYFLVISVVIWLRVISGVGLQTAIKKRLSEGVDRGRYLVAGAALQLAAFLVVATLLLLAEPVLTGYLRGVSSTVIIGLLFAALVFRFATSVLDGWHLVHVSSGFEPLNRFIRSVIQIGAIYLGYELLGLFVGYGVAAFVTAVVAALYLLPGVSVPRKHHFVDLLSYARYAWLTTVSGRAFASMDTIVLGIFVAEGFIGVYEIAWNLASLLAIFGTAITRSMFPAISELSAEAEMEDVAGLVTDSIRFAGLFLVPGFVGAAIMGTDVLRIYGGDFTRGGGILVILVGARLVYTYQRQFVSALNAVDRPDLAFRVEGGFVLVNLAGNLLLVWQFGWYGAAVATAISAVIGLVLGYRTLTSIIALSLPRTELTRQVVAAGIMGVFVLAGDVWLPGTLPISIGLVFAGSAIYGTVLVIISPRLRRVIRANLPSRSEP